MSARSCSSWSKGDARRSGSPHGPLPLDEALPIARQIAEALEAAHETGHHPSRSEAGQHHAHARTGTVKVLDFGLAKGSSTAMVRRRPDAIADADAPQAPSTASSSARPPT